MTSDQEQNSNGRSPRLIAIGLILLGVASALLFFGDDLFRKDEVVFEQVPQLDEALEGKTAVIPSTSGPIAVGDVAHNFILQDLDGNQYQLNDLRGQPVIVNFWATWCAPCRIEMPELQAAFETYQDDKLLILALDQDESPDVVRAFFYDEMELTFTPLLDDGGLVAGQYGVFNFPSTYFVNAEGVVTAVHRGPMVQSQLDGYLADTIIPSG